MKLKKRGEKLLLFWMAIFILFGVFYAGINTVAVHAATATTAKYKTSGTYSTGGDYRSGCPDNFAIYMHSSIQTSSTGTIYNDKVLNWTYVYIKIEVSALSGHNSFTLTKNNYTYISKALSGNSNQTLYSGALSDGEYELTYIGNYKPNWLSGTTTYTYKYRFIIDKTGPNYTLKAGTSSVSSGSYVNQQITYSVSDYKPYCIYYKKPGSTSYSLTTATSYSVEATSLNNGWWYFYAEDWYYNTNNTVSIYLDTIKPVGKVTNSSGITIVNGGYTNKPIKYTATDTGGISYYQYKMPSSAMWQSYTSGTSVSGTNGWYTFRCYDKANNVSEEYKVYYDSTTPSGTLYGGTSVKSNGSYTNANYIKYVASDSYSGIASCYVKMPGNSYYSAYSSGTQLATEGTYYFYSLDKSGNQSLIVSITLDKTKPTGTLYGGTSVVSSGSSTNASYIKFLPFDAIGLSATYVKKPGTTSYVAYTSGTQFTAEGTYCFYSVDKAGNVSATYTITLDRQIPTAQLYVDGNSIDNNGYTNGAHISFECEETCYVKLPGSDTFTLYVSGTEFYKAGKYVFYGISDAGNSTGYYTIVIDRSVKSLTVNNVTDGKTEGDVTMTWMNGNPDIYAPVKEVTVNGKPYVNGATIYTIDTGVYNVVCVDEAGNKWETSFTSSKTNVPTETFQKEYYEAHDSEGNYYTFASYDSALAFAVNREKSCVRIGEWNNETWDTGIAMDAKDSVNAINGTYYIYKKSDNPDEEVAYFTQERLNEVIDEYAKVGIEDYFYWEKEAAPIAEGENLYSYSEDKTILSDRIIFGDNIGTLIDGVEFVGDSYDEEGNHVLTVFDEWGNTCDYNLIVIREVPEIRYVIGEGQSNVVTFDRTYYFKDAVTVAIADEYDEFAMFNVYDERGELMGNFHLGDTFTLSDSGKYTVEAVNHFGISETFTLIISRDAPRVNIVENTEDKKLEIKVTASIDDESHIQTLDIYKSVDGGETWTALSRDDYGNIISADRLSYSFRTSGLYKVVVTDEFRTGIDAVTKVIDYTQKVPDGTLNGVENGGYTNGTVTFEWSDEAIVRVEKDGEVVEYTSGKVLSEDGNYTITFENFDGYKVVYTFTIDTVNPEIILIGAENGQAVTGDVSLTFEDEMLSAEIFKDGELLGAYESGTVITDSGEFTIIVTDFAGNKSETTFTIDKFVDYDINVNDKGLSNSVVATANEDVIVTLTKDGEQVVYSLGDEITEAGTYTLILTDKLGNQSVITFTVVDPLVQQFEYNFDKTPGFEKVTVNGEDKRLNYGTLELYEDGVYEITVYANGKTYMFVVEVDHTAPAITLEGVENGSATKGGVVISEVSEEATMKVYRDGVEIEYELGDKLKEIGQYKIVVEDKCGNVAEYSFEILYSMNGGAVALIVIGVLAIAGVVVFIVLKKRRVFKK